MNTYAKTRGQSLLLLTNSRQAFPVIARYLGQEFPPAGFSTCTVQRPSMADSY